MLRKWCESYKVKFHNSDLGLGNVAVQTFSFFLDVTSNTTR
jgi:hypothetical protein